MRKRGRQRPVGPCLQARSHPGQLLRARLKPQPDRGEQRPRERVKNGDADHIAALGTLGDGRAGLSRSSQRPYCIPEQCRRRGKNVAFRELTDAEAD